MSHESHDKHPWDHGAFIGEGPGVEDTVPAWLKKAQDASKRASEARAKGDPLSLMLAQIHTDYLVFATRQVQNLIKEGRG